MSPVDLATVHVLLVESVDRIAGPTAECDHAAVGGTHLVRNIRATTIKNQS